MALRVRYHYETSFFDARPADADDAADQVDDAINHPILQRLAGKVQRRDASTAAQRRSSFSSLGASVSSHEEEEQAGHFESVATLLNRSRSLQHRRQCGAFSLHLSPTPRTRIAECVLSPISDKSENDATQDAAPSTAAATPPALHRRRPRHLAPLVFAKSDAKAALNGSDSGISISANSLETSASDALPVRCLVQKATTGSLSSNSHEALSSSDSTELPFLMPKLKRSPGILQTLGPAFQAAGRPLSLTLPLPTPSAAAAAHPAAPLPADKDLADDAVPIDKQSWYHGSITRQDAENRLKPAPPGAFLVRDSLASHRDYFLAARSENGFLHVRIDCEWSDADKLDFALCTLPERRFASVAAIVNHCANVGIYCRNFPPLVLKYPLAEEAF